MAYKNVAANYYRYIRYHLHDRVSDIIPQRIIKFILRDRLVSILGHLVSDTQNPFVKFLYKYPNIKSFKLAMEKSLRYSNPVTLSQVVNHIVYGSKLPVNPLFLSFDDGHREMREIVAPMLYEMGVPAAFFVITDCIDNKSLIYPHKKSYLCSYVDEQWVKTDATIKQKIRGLLSIDYGKKKAFIDSISKLSPHNSTGRNKIDLIATLFELNWEYILSKELPYMTLSECNDVINMGFDIGSHGLDHTKFLGLSKEQQELQITQSSKFLRNKLSLKDIAFAFPNSSSGVSDQWMLEMVEKHVNLVLFFTTNKMQRNVYPYVNRINFDLSLNKVKGPIEKGFEREAIKQILTK